MQRKATSNRKGVSSESHQREVGSSKVDNAVSRKRKAKRKATPPVPVFEPKPEVKEEGEFGSGDDFPYVWEVHAPKEEEDDTKVEALEECEGAGGDDDVVLVSQRAESDKFPHARQDSRVYPFTKSNDFNSREAHGNNHLFAHNSFCYVCDCPASKCTSWCDNEDEPAHCNAFDTDVWNMRRYKRKNSLLSFLCKRSNDSTYKEFQTVKDRIDRAWRLYEAGDREEKPKGQKDVLNHKYTHVTSWFQHYFLRTDGLKSDDKENIWIQKFATVDALTEVMVTRSWRPPEHVDNHHIWECKWDQNAERMYDRIMLSLGSRWLTCYAKCDVQMLPRVTEIIRGRMTKLASQAKEKFNFDRGFQVLRDLVGEDRKATLKAVCNLYKSIIRRKEHHLNLYYTDKSEKRSELDFKQKSASVNRKDSVMLPLLSLLTVKKTAFAQLPIKLLRAQANAYHCFTKEKWQPFVDQLDAKSHDCISPVIRNMHWAVHANYMYSTKEKVKQKRLADYIEVSVCMIDTIVRKITACEEASENGAKILTTMLKIPESEPTESQKEERKRLIYESQKEERKKPRKKKDSTHMDGLALLTLAECLDRLNNGKKIDGTVGLSVTTSLAKLMTLVEECTKMELPVWYVQSITSCLKSFSYTDTLFTVAYERWKESLCKPHPSAKLNKKQDEKLRNMFLSDKWVRKQCGLSDDDGYVLGSVRDLIKVQTQQKYRVNVFQIAMDQLHDEKLDEEESKRIDSIVVTMKKRRKRAVGRNYREKKRKAEAEAAGVNPKKKSKKK